MADQILRPKSFPHNKVIDQGSHNKVIDQGSTNRVRSIDEQHSVHILSSRDRMIIIKPESVKKVNSVIFAAIDNGILSTSDFERLAVPQSPHPSSLPKPPW
jgi:hypothetical protein